MLEVMQQRDTRGVACSTLACFKITLPRMPDVTCSLVVWDEYLLACSMTPLPGQPWLAETGSQPNTPGWAEGRTHPESFLSSPPAQHGRVRVPSHRPNRCASGCPASPPGLLTSERKTCMHVVPPCPHPPETWAGLPSRVRATAAASCHCDVSTVRRPDSTPALQATRARRSWGPGVLSARAPGGRFSSCGTATSSATWCTPSS